MPEAGRLHGDRRVAQTVEWVAGAPRTSGAAERVYRAGSRSSACRRSGRSTAEGSFGAQADYRFNSEEGRDLVTGVAEQLGLRQQRGAAEKVGLVVAVIGGVGALVAVVAVLVMALTGRF